MNNQSLLNYNKAHSWNLGVHGGIKKRKLCL
jgi:hypothetical protein